MARDHTYQLVLDGKIANNFKSELNKLGGTISGLSDTQVVVDFDENATLANFKKLYQKLEQENSDLTIQFRYDINKMMLEKAQKELSSLEVYVDSDKANKEILELANELKSINLKLEVDGITANEEDRLYEQGEKIANKLGKIISTHISLDGSDKIFNDLSSEVKEIIESFITLNRIKEIKPFDTKSIEKQRKEVDEIKTIMTTLKEKGATDKSATNINTEEIERLKNQIQSIESEVAEMKEQMNSLNGDSFERITESVGTLEKKVLASIEAIKRLSDISSKKPIKIAYHVGDLDHLDSTKKSETFADMIDSLEAGEYNERGYGYGSHGTGTYLTTDIDDFQRFNKKQSVNGYAIDLSKYNLLTVKTEEQGVELLKFLSNLEAFTIAQGANYEGFNDTLEGIDEKALFEQYQSIFDEVFLDFKQFSAFVKEMITLVKNAGGLDGTQFKDISEELANSDNIGTRFLKKLGYEGVDFSGFSKLDNLDQGTTIFDLDTIVPYMEKFEDFNELVTYNGKILNDLVNTQKQVPNGFQEISEAVENLTTQISNLNDEIAELKDNLSSIKAQDFKANIPELDTTTLTSENQSSVLSGNQTEVLSGATVDNLQQGINESEQNFRDVNEVVSSFIDTVHKIASQTAQMFSSGDISQFKESSAFFNPYENTLLSDVVTGDFSETNAEMTKAAREYLENICADIIGYFHSHPAKTASFSDQDLSNQISNFINDGIYKHLLIASEEVMELDYSQSNPTEMAEFTKRFTAIREKMVEMLFHQLTTNAIFDSVNTDGSFETEFSKRFEESSSELMRYVEAGFEERISSFYDFYIDEIKGDGEFDVSNAIQGSLETSQSEEDFVAQMHLRLSSLYDKVLEGYTVPGNAEEVKKELALYKDEVIRRYILPDIISVYDDFRNNTNDAAKELQEKADIFDQKAILKTLESFPNKIKIFVGSVEDYIEEATKLISMSPQESALLTRQSKIAGKYGDVSKYGASSENAIEEFVSTTVKETQDVIDRITKNFRRGLISSEDQDLAINDTLGELYGKMLNSGVEELASFARINELEVWADTNIEELLSKIRLHISDGLAEWQGLQQELSQFANSRPTTTSPLLEVNKTPLSSPTLFEDESGQLSFVEQTKKSVDLIEEESGQMSMFGNVAEKATDSAIEGQMTLNDILNKNIEGQMNLNDLVAKQDTATPIKDTFDASTESQDMDKVATATDEAVQAKKDFATANEGVQNSVDGSKSKLELEAELMERLAKSAREAADAKKEFVKANKEVENSEGTSGSKKSKVDKTIEKINSYNKTDSFFGFVKNGNLDSKKYQNIASEINDIIKKQGKYASSVKDSAEEVQKLDDTAQKFADDFENKFQKQQLALADSLENKIQRISSGKTFDDENTKIISDIENDIERLRDINLFDVNDLTTATKVSELISEINQNINKIKNVSNNPIALMPEPEDVNKGISQINKVLSGGFKLPRKLRSEFEELRISYQRAFDNNGNVTITNAKLQDLDNTLSKLNAEFEATGKHKSVFGSLTSRITDMNAKFLASYFSFQDILNYARQAYQYVAEIDKQMIELEKVSDMSASRLAESFDHAKESAKDLGSTVSDVIAATADWSRLGYDADAAEQLAEVATIYKNVGDGIDISTANESLISTLQGFQMEASQAMEIVDSFNEVKLCLLI